MKFLYSSLLLILGILQLSAQYPPAVGEMGTTAIAADSSIFVGWAQTASVSRGLMDIQEPDLGETSVGTEADVLGQADNFVLSLGDGGAVTLSFEHPIYDGLGWDFAVFENSFDGLFLELAFIEVSSDGEHFFRFPNASLTSVEEPIGAFGLLDPTKIHNLAGKYIGGYGTPFDLAELSGIEGLDIMHISHIRVIDVVGTLDDDWSTYDSEGRKINDPYPTPFPSGGFDLDGVGVIHWNIDAGVSDKHFFNGVLYPNPTSEGQPLFILSDQKINAIEVFSVEGVPISAEIKSVAVNKMRITGLKPGVWLLLIYQEVGEFWQKIIVK